MVINGERERQMVQLWHRPAGENRVILTTPLGRCFIYSVFLWFTNLYQAQAERSLTIRCTWVMGVEDNALKEIFQIMFQQSIENHLQIIIMVKHLDGHYGATITNLERICFNRQQTYKPGYLSKSCVISLWGI